jgi:hypothetical protein
MAAIRSSTAMLRENLEGQKEEKIEALKRGTERIEVESNLAVRTELSGAVVRIRYRPERLCKPNPRASGAAPEN